MSVSLNWNLIGSLGSAAVISDVDGLMIPGTLYGFDGSYQLADQLEPGRAYWTASSADGEIVLQPAGASSLSEVGGTENSSTQTEITTPARLIRAGIVAEQPFYGVEIYATEEHSEDVQTKNVYNEDVYTADVYTAEKLAEFFFGGTYANHPLDLQTSLPPYPPTGLFDARLSDNRWITESNRIAIYLQQDGRPLTLKIREDAPSDVQIRFYAATEASYSPTDVTGVNGVNDEAGVAGMAGVSGVTGVTDVSGVLLEEHLVRADAGVPIPPAATFIDVELAPLDSRTLPGSYHLSQNYPNPFNPTTRIVFDLPASGDVRLEVFDMLGRKVAVLADGWRDAGSYDVVFDGRDLSSGIYIVRMQLNAAGMAGAVEAVGPAGVVMTRKMTLMK